MLGYQIINKGPTIPLKVVEAQRNGELIIFCGAGISMNSGLGNFAKLTKDVYEELCPGEILHQPGVPDDDLDISALEYRRNNYDRVLQILEDKVEDKFRLQMDEWLSNLNKRKLKTHKAIINLSIHNDRVKLVTTNQDEAFAHLNKSLKLNFEIDSAPKMPVAKPHRWNSLVHLHGLKGKGIENYVITSSDFGAAYITERWASKFITEVFAQYSVLFIGYSIDDTVLRYVTDAIAADRKHGTNKNNVYILAAIDKANPKKQILEWKAKNVELIPYESTPRHHLLHDTLTKWSERSTSGYLGFKRLVKEIIFQKPDTTNYKTKILLHDLYRHDECTFKLKNPEYFKYFAEPLGVKEKDIQNQAHPNWIKVLSNYEKDLSSALKRDVEYVNALVGDYRTKFTDLQEKSFLIVQWFLSILETKPFIEWVLERGSVLHPILVDSISHWLKKHKLKNQNYEQFWLYITNYRHCLVPKNESVKFNAFVFNRGQFATQIELDEIKSTIHPITSIKKGISYHDTEEGDDTSELIFDVKFKIESHVDWPLLRSSISKSKNKRYLFELAIKINEYLQHIQFAEYHFGKSSQYFDYSHYALSSLKPHKQNNYFEKWAHLIDLLAFICTKLSNKNPELIKSLVQGWLINISPLNFRFILYVAQWEKVITTKELEKILFEHSILFLWASTTMRERFIFLKNRWKKLPIKFRQKILGLIYNGPPKILYRSDISRKELKEYSDRQIFNYLKWFQFHRISSGKKGTALLKRLNKTYPKWRAQKGEKAEFSHWMESGRDMRRWETNVITIFERYKTPKSFFAHVEKSLETTHELSRFYTIFKTEKGQKILVWAINNNITKNWFWNEVFFLFSQKEYLVNNHKAILKKIDSLKIEIKQQQIHNIARILETLHQEKIYSIESNYKLWEFYINLSCQKPEEITSISLTSSLNYSTGILGELLMKELFWRERKINEGLPNFIKRGILKIKTFPTPNQNLCLIHIGMRVTSLSMIDPTWVEKELFPLMNWTSKYAFSLWDGFFSTARYDPTLFAKLKREYLLCLEKKDFRDTQINIFRLTTAIAIYNPELLNPTEFRTKVLANASDENKEQIIDYIYSHFRGEKENEKLWQDVLFGFIQNYLPFNIFQNVKGVTEKILLILSELTHPRLVDLNLFQKFISTSDKSSNYWLSQLDEKLTDLPHELNKQIIHLISSALGSANILYEVKPLVRILKRMERINKNITRLKEFKKLKELISKSNKDYEDFMDEELKEKW